MLEKLKRHLRPKQSSSSSREFLRYSIQLQEMKLLEHKKHYAYKLAKKSGPLVLLSSREAIDDIEMNIENLFKQMHPQKPRSLFDWLFKGKERNLI